MFLYYNLGRSAAQSTVVRSGFAYKAGSHTRRFVRSPVRRFGLYFPKGQSRHSATEVLPKALVDMKVPAGHLVQSLALVSPLLRPYVPGKQSVWSGSPVPVGQKDPRGQTSTAVTVPSPTQ